MIEKISSPKFFYSLFIILVLYMTVVMMPTGFIGAELQKNMPKSVTILDMQYGYSVDTAYQVLLDLGELGRFDYLRNLLTIDIILPIIYSLTYVSLILMLLGRIAPPKNSYRIIACLPFFAAIFDLIENFSVAAMILNYPTRIPLLAQVANVATQIKTNFLNISSLIIFIEIIFLVRISLKRKSIKKDPD